MFRGNCPTRLDEKGRLKIPADFKHVIDRKYDGQFYITSFEGKVIQLYPLQEWEKLEERVLKQSASNSKVHKFLDLTSYYGQVLEMDGQGRLTIAERLRNLFGLKGEVAVIGMLDHISIRVSEEYDSHAAANPMTQDELDELPLRARD
jgi:MraZ protein